MLINSDGKLSNRKLKNVKEYIHSEDVMDSFTWIKKKYRSIYEIRIQVSGTLEISQKVKLLALQVAYWPIRDYSRA